MTTDANAVMIETASDTLGKHRRKSKPWVTEEIIEMCDTRRNLKKEKNTEEGAAKYFPIVKSLNNGKAAGNDNIPAELLKKGGEAVIDILTNICNKICQTGEWPTHTIIDNYSSQERKPTTISKLSNHQSH